MTLYDAYGREIASEAILPDGEDRSDLKYKYTEEMVELRNRIMERTRTKEHHFTPALPVKHLNPNGFMPVTIEACALWQFLLMGHQCVHRVEAQVTYQGDTDQSGDLMNIAFAAVKMFGLALDRETAALAYESVFQERLLETAIMEAQVSKLPIDPRVIRFIQSGGHLQRKHERDPDKVNH